jgi:16S rRNA (cytidine1402-2'-O)-methyltransferase
MGTLYVVSTPAGDTQGLSLEALRVLKEVSLIAAQDTRRTRELLNHFGISTPLTSLTGCHPPNSPSCAEDLLQALRRGDVAVVMGVGALDLSGPSGPAGPAGQLVAAALRAGFAVRAVPDPSPLPATEEAARQARANSREAYNRLYRSRIVDDEY